MHLMSDDCEPIDWAATELTALARRIAELETALRVLLGATGTHREVTGEHDIWLGAARDRARAVLEEQP